MIYPPTDANFRHWTLEFISAGCLELTGYPPEDLVPGGKTTYNQLILPEDRVAVRVAVQNALQERRLYQLTYRITTAAGDQRWVWDRGCGIFSPQGKLQALELTSEVSFVYSIWTRRRCPHAWQP